MIFPAYYMLLVHTKTNLNIALKNYTICDNVNDILHIL
jgi:hypothetical protein